MSSLDELRPIASRPYQDKSRRPIWIQIFERLEEAMHAGVLPEGSRLPGEDDLAALFGVSRVTLRRALARHQREGRLLARKGVGVFVRSLSVRYVVHPNEAFNDALDKREIRSELLSMSRRPADASAARLLQLDPGAEVIELATLSAVSSGPIYLAHKLFPAAIFPRFEAVYGETHSILAAYASGGVESYRRIETRIFGDVATQSEAERLQLDPGAAVIRSRSLNTDPAGRLIEYNRGCWPLFSVELVFGSEKQSTLSEELRRLERVPS